MSKTVPTLLLASIILLLCAVGSCEVGQRKWQNEVEELERRMEASGFYISHVYAETNGWQFAGGILFFACISIALAAFMLWKQDRERKSD